MAAGRPVARKKQTDSSRSFIALKRTHFRLGERVFLLILDTAEAGSPLCPQELERLSDGFIGRPTAEVSALGIRAALVVSHWALHRGGRTVKGLPPTE
jgi:hypothetical protein